MMQKSDWYRTVLRLPPDIKVFLGAQVELNASSLNSEVVRSIRQRMDRLNRTETERVPTTPRLAGGDHE
jgi:hypothetical protein